MRNIELSGLSQVFEDIADIPQSTKFNYAFNKNRKKLWTYLRGLDQSKPHAKHGEFENKRVELCEKFCTRDDDGEVILEDNRYTGLGDNEEFDSAIEALKVEFTDVVTHSQDNRKKYNETMQEEATFKMHMVSMEDVLDGFSPNQLNAVGVMITGYKEWMGEGE